MLNIFDLTTLMHTHVLFYNQRFGFNTTPTFGVQSMLELGFTCHSNFCCIVDSYIL